MGNLDTIVPVLWNLYSFSTDVGDINEAKFRRDTYELRSQIART
jgi:hypothetical protein